jgi:hypothetical protein
LADTGAVTLNANTITTGCSGALATSTDRAGGPIVIGPDEAPFATAVPEPGSLLLVGSGIAGFIARRRAAGRRV